MLDAETAADVDAIIVKLKGWKEIEQRIKNDIDTGRMAAIELNKGKNNDN